MAQPLTCPTASKGCFLLGLQGPGSCPVVRLLGAAGHGCPRPVPAVSAARAAWGQGSAPRGPHDPSGLSWASSTLRVKGPAGLGSLERESAGAPGPSCWQQLSQCTLACVALSSAWAFSVPCPSAQPHAEPMAITPGALSQGDICQLPCCGWDPGLNRLPPQLSAWPPLGPWVGHTCPALLSPGPPGSWSISLWRGRGGQQADQEVPEFSRVGLGLLF